MQQHVLTNNLWQEIETSWILRKETSIATDELFNNQPKLVTKLPVQLQLLFQLIQCAYSSSFLE